MKKTHTEMLEASREYADRLLKTRRAEREISNPTPAPTPKAGWYWVYDPYLCRLVKHHKA